MLPLIGLVCSVLSSTFAQQLTVVHQWNLFTYNTPSWYPKNSTFGGNPISSIEVGYDRIFLAVPREFAVTPASLVYIPKEGSENTLLEAYPSWEWHTEAVGAQSGELHCQGIINAVKLQVDKCGRLWVLDNGNLYGTITSREVNVCPPKLIIFDLQTNQEVRRIDFPKDIATSNSRFKSFVIDYLDEQGTECSQNCDGGFVYISNQKNPSIIVYNQQTSEYWSLSDPSFYPDPAHAKFEVFGAEAAIAVRGVHQIALRSYGHGGRLHLFYSPTASKTIYCVDTAALKAGPRPAHRMELPIKKVAEKSSQSIALAVDPVEKSLIFDLYNETSIVSWYPEERKSRVLSIDPEALQGVTAIQSAILDDDSIWVVSTRAQRSYANNLDSHEINQRVMRFNKPPHVPLKYFIQGSNPPELKSGPVQFYTPSSNIPDFKSEPIKYYTHGSNRPELKSGPVQFYTQSSNAPEFKSEPEKYYIQGSNTPELKPEPIKYYIQGSNRPELKSGPLQFYQSSNTPETVKYYVQGSNTPEAKSGLAKYYIQGSNTPDLKSGLGKYYTQSSNAPEYKSGTNHRPYQEGQQPRPASRPVQFAFPTNKRRPAEDFEFNTRHRRTE